MMPESGSKSGIFLSKLNINIKKRSNVKSVKTPPADQGKRTRPSPLGNGVDRQNPLAQQIGTLELLGSRMLRFGFFHCPPVSRPMREVFWAPIYPLQNHVRKETLLNV